MDNSWIFPELKSMRQTIERMIRHAVENAKGNSKWENVADDLIDAKLLIGAAIRIKEGPSPCKKMKMCAIGASIILATVANAGINGFATWFTVQSCRREGTSGITAGGRLLDESKMWCALPSRPPADGSGRRAWGRKVRITNLSTGKSVVCEQWDVGPGRAAVARGVCVDLTPAAFLAVGGQLKNGRLAVRVELL